MSRVNKAGRTLLLLAVDHATLATDKEGRGKRGRGGGLVKERIQHEDDLQHRLSQAERGERRVPDASILGEGDTTTGTFTLLQQQTYGLR